MVHLPLIHKKPFREIHWCDIVSLNSASTRCFMVQLLQNVQGFANPHKLVNELEVLHVKNWLLQIRVATVFTLSVQAQSLKFSSSLWNCRVIHMSINRENLGTARAKHVRWSLHREIETGKISLHQLGCEQKTARWQNESLNQLFANLPVVDPESYPLCPSNQREYSLYKDKESRQCLKDK